MSRIYSVSSVSLDVLDTDPHQLLITAIGQVVSSGWSGPELTDLSTVEPPPDGLLNFDFSAEPPSGVWRPALYPIVVQRLWEGDLSRVRGVRVYGSSNTREQTLQAGAVAQRALRGSVDPFRLGGAASVPPGVPTEAIHSPQPAVPAPPQMARPPEAKPSTPTADQPLILMGGTWQEEEIGDGEGTGFVLYEVLVEVDASRIPDPARFAGRQVIVEGSFGLKTYPQRGGVWTFYANKLRSPGM